MICSEVLQGSSNMPGVCPGRIVQLMYGSPNDIELFRGNSAAFEVKPVNEKGEEIKLGEGDKVIFSVSYSPNSPLPATRPLFYRILDSSNYDNQGRLLIVLNPEDTANLQDRTYYYDVAISFADGQFYTFIPFAKLVIKPAGSDIQMLKKSEEKPDNTEESEDSTDDNNAEMSTTTISV